MKWIGGATAAVVLLFGGATLANRLSSPEDSEQAALALDVDAAKVGAGQTIDEVIPAQEAQLAEGAAQQQPAAAQQDDPFVIKRILPIDGPIKYGQWFWDDKDVPEGPIVITVDLDARVISAFKGGFEIGAAAAMLGTDDHPTPLGTFPILYKDKDNVSEKYGDAPMPFSLFLTRDGVAIHGGHQVENGYASHGCVSVPTEFAEKLFAITGKGDKVIITRGKMVGMGDKIL